MADALRASIACDADPAFLGSVEIDFEADVLLERTGDAAVSLNNPECNLIFIP